MIKRSNAIIVGIIAVVCLAAGTGVYKVASSKTDNTNLSTNLNSKNNEESKSLDSSSNLDNNADNNDNSSKDSETKKTVVKGVNTKTEKTMSSKKESTKNLKNEYLAKLAEIEKKDKACGLDSAKTTVDMNTAQNNRYKLWDDELNIIYGVLKKQLPKDKMSSLEKEESAWIKQKEANGEKAAKKFEGGSAASLERTASFVKDTRERCYYLVNNYMQ